MPRSTGEFDVRKFPHFTLYKETPANPTHRIPVLIVPGFGSSAASFLLLSNELNARGFTTIRIQYEWGRPGEPKKWWLIPDVDKLKQQAIFTAIQEEGVANEDEEGVKQVIVITHSKGAMDVTHVAAVHPELFRDRTIVMGGPSNLGPKENRIKALRKLRAGNRADKQHKIELAESGEEGADLVQPNNDFSHDYAKKHRLHYFADALSSAWGSVYDILPKLRENHIRTIIIAQTEDAFNAPESFEVVRDRVDGIIPVKGIHGAVKFISGVAKSIADVVEKYEATS